MLVIHIRHPFTVLECSCHTFRCGACDLEHFSSGRTSIFPFHWFKLKFWVMVVNPRLIAYNHTWIEELWVCLYQINRAVLIMGSGIYGVNFPSTHLTHVLHTDKCSSKTVWIVSIDKAVSCTILSMLIIRFSGTTWWTFWTFYSGLRHFTTRMVFIFNVIPSSSELS